jgi:hypothetical protein
LISLRKAGCSGLPLLQTHESPLMAKLPARSYIILVETFSADIPGKAANVHVRPVPGQQFPVDMEVECSRALRTKHPVGTVFRIKAKLAEHEAGTSYLFSHHRWRYELVEE